MTPGSKDILPSDAGGFQSRPASGRCGMTVSFDSQLTETKKVRHTGKIRLLKLKIIIYYMFSQKITG